MQPVNILRCGSLVVLQRPLPQHPAARVHCRPHLRTQLAHAPQEGTHYDHDEQRRRECGSVSELTHPQGETFQLTHRQAATIMVDVETETYETVSGGT
jgi:hypothetical protein